MIACVGFFFNNERMNIFSYFSSKMLEGFGRMPEESKDGGGMRVKRNFHGGMRDKKYFPGNGVYSL